MVFLVTDGKSNRVGHLTIPSDRHLKDLGQRFSWSLWEKMSYPPKDYLFRVKKLDGFLQIIKLMVQRYSPRKYAIIKSQYTRPCLREECTKIKRTAFLGIFPASLFCIAILK